ncbi:MspA family porin [Nocardia sp. XZ_19_385]|uniref:MspA family porin n=1 Tax=Nocardia sp. XZ_19_385 TaxID=2769488 RepID=UPI0018903FF6|nr:MspA family porin [Nocardia sp. XZ_19_385]
MNTNPSTGSGVLKRSFGIVGTTVAAVGLFAPGAANADVFVPLPDGQKAAPGALITRTGERALVSPSLSANGAGRVVWVSGMVVAEVTETPEGKVGPDSGPSNDPGSNNSATFGASQLNTGYIIGCQVSIGDDAISLGAKAGATLKSASISGSIGLKIAPGEVRWVQLERADIPKPGTYFVDYTDVEMSIEGCAGYAQARAYTNLEIIGNTHTKTTLYGQPFSIG